ncbi:PREDICTED: HIRA-interacting protein 3 [Pseudopodoces humilis]|uniref:HIRA-interacting protein 3 n=1 Tax=Pseudopodoces humilis TaxID=181119 RepID=UPI0006B7C08F|nr:PREDICTED: HIRA-interacting protein 3 [Pseudopodoces humilis]
MAAAAAPSGGDRAPDRGGEESACAEQEGGVARGDHALCVKTESEEEEEEEEEEEPKKPLKIPKKRRENSGSDSEDSEDLPLAKWAEKGRKRGREKEEESGRKRRKEEEGEEWWRQRKDTPEVTRLKRYLRAAGWRPNYKRLFRKCRSQRELLEALRGALRDMGLHGTPSLARCRRLRRRREEKAELAALDAANILPARSRRRNPENCQKSPPESPLPPPDWSRLRGIVSSDSE